MRGHPDFDFLVRRQQQLSASGHAYDAWAPGATRVLIAESSRMVAEALILAIDVEPSLEPIGYAVDGWEALELTESLCPDVIVVGPRLKSLSSLTLTRLLTECWPHVSVIVLTETHMPEQIGEAQAAGAADCLPLDRSADELIDAIATASVRPLRLADTGAAFYAHAEASLV
jgi:DNA-binding NarL/FixJ family response regulator